MHRDLREHTPFTLRGRVRVRARRYRGRRNASDRLSSEAARAIESYFAARGWG